MPAIKSISLDFTDLEIYDHILIGSTHEGEQLTRQRHKDVMKIARQEFGTQPYAIILDEKYQYSVDFDVMMMVRRDPQIICASIVSYRFTTIKALLGPAYIIKKPFKFFKNINDAIHWSHQQLGK